MIPSAVPANVPPLPEYHLTRQDFEAFLANRPAYEVMADSRAIFALGLLASSGQASRAEFLNDLGLEVQVFDQVIQKLVRAHFVAIANESFLVTAAGLQFVQGFFSTASGLPFSNVPADTRHGQATPPTGSRTASRLQEKIRNRAFDVFLCHNWNDKPEVKRIGERLKERSILPWLDEWELQPGLPWQRLLEEQIGSIKSAAVFVGEDGIGPWQRQELDAFLREFVNRGCPVIPVLLASAPAQPELPIFLRGMTWVDFRIADPDPMERLIWGITGQREGVLESR